MREGEGSELTVEVYGSFAELLDSGLQLVVIDVPIGIMQSSPRAVDRAARELLRDRACCVFSAPYRPMLYARSHDEASAIRAGIDGKRCTRQAFSIFKKIREVDALLTPALQERVREGHPEVTFAVMQDGRPMENSKKSRLGRMARLDALRRHFPKVDDSVAERRPKGVGIDDVLDAYALLWTARRIAGGSARTLPILGVGSDQRDIRGLRAEIVA